jgi:hypothetical protein
MQPLMTQREVMKLKQRGCGSGAQHTVTSRLIAVARVLCILVAFVRPYPFLIVSLGHNHLCANGSARWRNLLARKISGGGRDLRGRRGEIMTFLQEVSHRPGERCRCNLTFHTADNGYLIMRCTVRLLIQVTGTAHMAPPSLQTSTPRMR